MTKEERAELEAKILAMVKDMKGDMSIPNVAAILMFESMDMAFKLMPPEDAFESILECAKRVARSHGMEIQTDLRQEKIH